MVGSEFRKPKCLQYFHQGREKMTIVGKRSKRLRHYLKIVCVPLAAVVFVLMLAARAAAFTSILPPFTGASDFITGFPTCESGLQPGEFLGPLGVLFDGAHFFADDVCNGITYRFAAAGGDASTPDAKATNLLREGLTLKGGVYYGNTLSGLYKFDPTTLSTTLITTFPLTVIPKLVLGLVGDPLNSDLYVSTTSGLFRVQNPNSGSPILTNRGGCFDGIAFTADGSRFYGAVCGSSLVFGVDRTTSQRFLVDTGHQGVDGIAVALNNTTLSGIDVSNNVFVNNNDGTLVRIDVNNGNAVSVVASGGTRGDFATVGPDNCLYVTQSDRIEKMSPCFFQVSIANKCPLGSGNWKNNPAWPVTSLTLGSQSYTEAELTVILKTPAGGDASLILADALIATELSIAGD